MSAWSGETTGPGKGWLPPPARARSRTGGRGAGRHGRGPGPAGPLHVCLGFGTLAARAADTCPGEMDLFPAPECWSSPLTDHREHPE